MSATRTIDESYAQNGRGRGFLPSFSQSVQLQIWAYAFLFPMVALLVAFKFWPMIQAFQLSLHSYDLLTPPRYVGLSNYNLLLGDPKFIRSVGVTLYFMFGTCIPLWVLSLGLAVAFNRSFPGRGLIRLAYFIPCIMPTVVYGTVWRFLYHPYGIVNLGLQSIGLPPLDWLSSSTWVIPAFILSTEWRLVPYFMIVFLAGLQGIPEDLKEAASIDGASPIQSFWHITIPLLQPTILLVVIVSLIMMSRSFTNAYVMTGGGPNGASLVIGLYIYEAAFTQFRMGVASAASMMLLAGTMLLTGLQLWLFRDRRAV
jgi:ABC-type sugar transport system permease subunit